MRTHLAPCRECEQQIRMARVAARWQIRNWQPITGKWICTRCTLDALFERIVWEVRIPR